MTGTREEHSFNSNDSVPFVGYSSDRRPIFPIFHPSSINHMGDSTVQNTDENQRKEEIFAKGIEDFIKRLLEDKTLKLT